MSKYSEYFTANISDETMAKLIDETLRFEKNNKTNKSKIKSIAFKIIPAAAVFLLIIGLANLTGVLNQNGVENIFTPGAGASLEGFTDTELAEVADDNWTEVLLHIPVGEIIFEVPMGQAPVQNDDGSITLPGGGSFKQIFGEPRIIISPSVEVHGATITVGSGTVIERDGSIKLDRPENKGKSIIIVSSNGMVVAVDENGETTIDGMTIDELEKDLREERQELFEGDNGEEERRRNEEILKRKEEEIRRFKERMSARMDFAADINPEDYRGWLIVGDNLINSPLVQGKDNRFYLEHGFTGRPSSSGAIFLDSRNNPDFHSNYNTVIYGHNMLDGSMFAPVTEYLTNKEAFDSGTINLYQDGVVYVYEIFSVITEAENVNTENINAEIWDMYMSDIPGLRVEFADSDDFIEYANGLQSRSVFYKEIPINADSRIVTLRTMGNSMDPRIHVAVSGILLSVWADRHYD